MNNENSTFIHNEACPKCRANGKDRHGDNLAIYDDGHAFCWSCGYYRPHSIVCILSKRDVVRNEPTVYLPGDCNVSHSQAALDWIGKYEITKKDLLQHGVLYSEQGKFINLKGKKTQCSNLLIFPVWGDDGDLLAWQGRYFGDNPDVPKWIGKGKLNKVYNIIYSRARQPAKVRSRNGKRSGPLVLTEDVVSAIKVNKAGYDAMPLYGVETKSRWGRIKLLGYDKAILFLDPDMHSRMINDRVYGPLNGVTVDLIFSNRDPKKHTINEIQDLIDDRI